MRRGPKPAKAKAEAEPRKSPKNDSAMVRDLEKRLAEAIEQQTATGEILRVIADSPAELQAVLNAVAERAARLCGANDSMIFQVDGDALRPVVRWGSVPTVLDADTRIPISRAAVTGRALVDRAAVHIHDITTRFDEFSVSQRYMGRTGVRTVLAMPLLRHNTAIGAIQIRRLEIQPFTDKQIELLKTFADQAVIAIENARLFTETKEALEQQTATSEILRVISSSPTDVQPVFDAIVRAAVRLCQAVQSNVQLFDGQLMYFVAAHNIGPAAMEMVQRIYPMPPNRNQTGSRAILDNAVVHVPDVLEDPEYLHELAVQGGWRSVLSVPMMGKGRPIGAITVTRMEPGLFSDTEIALLQTFADQAVIAIENVRLFTELEARNRDLTEALQQQTATAEILRVIASSPTDIQPVLDAVAQNAARVCGADDALIYRVDGDVYQRVAHHGPIAETAVFERRLSRDTVSGRATVDRRTIHVPDIEAAPGDELPETRRLARLVGARTHLAAPLIREGAAIGAILIRCLEVRPFAPKQITLLETFADQAVIAIENVRLFRELEEKNRALTQAHAQVTESLEQQTATSEILGVISSSPTDVQPVFDTIAESSLRLCGALFSSVYRFDGELIHMVAHQNYPQVALERSRQLFPARPSRQLFTARAILECAVVHVPDVLQDPNFAALDLVRDAGFRSVLAVPIIHRGNPVGAITVWHAAVAPFSQKHVDLLRTFADQAVIAIENVRLFNETKEALERQTATSEILQVISQSPTDTQPVFEAIVERALRLSEATAGAVTSFDGELIHVVASNLAPDSPILRVFPMRPSRTGSLTARAVLERQIIHVPDALAEPGYDVSQQAAESGYRSVLSVPMMREGTVLGTITVGRSQAGPYLDRQIALLQTFADQAVIAIENVRLFNETKEALEQQTATAEILRVISSSPTDVQPVFDAVAESAARLCEAQDASIFRREGDRLAFVAHHGPIAQRHGGFSLPLVRGTVGGRSVLESRTVQVADLQNEDREFPAAVEHARRFGFRTILSVPLLREGIAIGGIQLRRTEVQLFSERQIALLQTFADQAVIAIENVRLFTELQEKNRALTAALEQQTATSEILRAITHAPTDTQPVFDTIVRSAATLCHAAVAAVFLTDGQRVSVPANYGSSPEALAAVRAQFPRPLEMESTGGMAILTRSVVQVPDSEGASVVEFVRQSGRRLGFRSLITVPMLREGEAVGAIGVYRREPGRFSDAEVELLKTFADQAVIAIENVRLLTELQARTQELTRSVGQLTALGEVGRAVSSTLDLQTVLTTIVGRAVELSGTSGGVIYEHDEATHEFRLRASHHIEPELVELLRDAPFSLGQGVTGRAAALRTPVQVRDLLTEREFALARVSPIAERLGYRSVLAVPLLLEDRVMGGLTVWRKQPGDFAPEVVHLLQTFAAQSSLALQNARLFREIADKSRQLEVASQHKSEFLANMSHELRTPLNAIIGFSEVLSERMFGELNEKQEEYLNDIYASGTHLLSLINDILDLSKIEAGRMELELIDFHLPTALDSALTLVRERAGRRSITLHTNIDTRLGQIQADERKVRQVVLNLLSNAVKFTPEGGRIEVGAVPKDGFVEISVSDTGVGIAPEDQEAVFEEFRQVGTAAKKVEGTGLGLTLCRKFVELHGGRIWVKSEPGVGSTFTFTLPVLRGE
jgi:GAF domain-containing protein